MHFALVRPRTSRRLLAGAYGALVSMVLFTRSAAAQSVHLPALQLPVVSERDYTAAFVGGGGTAALVQWREALNSRSHWQLDAGMADPTGRTDPMLLVGIGAARALQPAAAKAPFDLLLTGGASLALGGTASVVRVPVGVSMGRGFDLEGGTRLTAFVHPRLSLDYCARCGVAEGSRSTLSVNADIGAAWRFEPRWELLTALSFTGSELVSGDQTLSVGVRFVPEALRRR